MSPDDTQQVIQDLKAARAELVRRGRCKGRMVTEQGQVCARGAIGAVTDERFVDLYLDGAKTDYGVTNWARSINQPRALRALKAVEAHLPDDLYVRTIEWFNDDPETTDADVLTVFDKALAELGGLGDA